MPRPRAKCRKFHQLPVVGYSMSLPSIGGDAGRGAPIALLFRSDFKRHWNRGSLRTALVVVAAVLLLQALVGLLLVWGIPVLGIRNWGWVNYATQAMGVHSQWSTPVLQAIGLLPSTAPTPVRIGPTWAVVSLGLLDVVVQTLLPAFAALSIAPDRENGRLEELTLAGFRPRQILLAKGLAALLPLLLLWTVVRLVSTAVWLGAGASETIPKPLQQTSVWLWVQGTAVVAFASRAVLLVSLSALSSRFRTALVGCYATAFVLIPLIQAINLIPIALRINTPAWFGPLFFGPAILGGVAAVIVAIRAVRALEGAGNRDSPVPRPQVT